MLFVEPRFFVFFAIVFALYWSLTRNRDRKIVLLVASYIFYGAWDPRFTLLLAFSTVFDYGAGLAMEATANPHRRKLIIVVSLLVNLSLLFTFKYFNFFTDSFVALLHTAGIQANPVTLRLILPVGISFYTFQSLSYTLDIYRGHMHARRNLLDYATFVGFFPQLVAGPIVRAYDFLPQLDSLRRFDTVPVRATLIQFFFGFVKKACVSDNLAPYVDAVFSHPANYDGTSIVAATVLYAIQIYCDFSGYTDMAIATAKLLGFDLTVNFPPPVFLVRHHRFLAALAYQPVVLAARLSLYPAGRQSRQQALWLPQSDGDDDSGRALARRVVEFRDLGHAAWRRAGRAQGICPAPPGLPDRSAGLSGRRHAADLLVGLPGLDLLPRDRFLRRARHRAQLRHAERKRHAGHRRLGGHRHSGIGPAPCAGGAPADFRRAALARRAPILCPGRHRFRRRAGPDPDHLPAVHLFPVLRRRAAKAEAPSEVAA
ncbi:MAG: MBOAT family O-acyltransferase [Aliidongia sp.]